MSKRNALVDALVSLALALAIVIAVMAIATKLASAGQLVDCAESPGHGQYVYRIVDGRRCWFPANGLRRGREKPAEELYWVAPAAMTPTMPETDKFEQRWRGDAAPERNHKE